MFTRKEDLAAILQFIIYIRDSCNDIPHSLLRMYNVCVRGRTHIAVLFSVQRLLRWIMSFKWVRVSDPWQIKNPFCLYVTWSIRNRDIIGAFSSRPQIWISFSETANNSKKIKYRYRDELFNFLEIHIIDF